MVMKCCKALQYAFRHLLIEWGKILKPIAQNGGDRDSRVGGECPLSSRGCMNECCYTRIRQYTALLSVDIHAILADCYRKTQFCKLSMDKLIYFFRVQYDYTGVIVFSEIRPQSDVTYLYEILRQLFFYSTTTLETSSFYYG